MGIVSKDKIDGKSSRTQLRMCVEFGVPEYKDYWREQIMFHADVKAGSTKRKATAEEKETKLTWGKQLVARKGGDNGVVLKNLAKGLYLCSLAENNEIFVSNSGQSDYIEHTHKADPKKPLTTKEATAKKNLFIDWKRPLAVGDGNSMNFQSGKTYEVFMSFF